MIKVGSRVSWFRCGAPFGGHMVGRVRKIYDFHGAKKLKIVSNGVTYSVLEEDVTLDE